MRKRQTTSDALAILEKRYFTERATERRALAQAEFNARIAQKIYALRIQAGLTRQQLAKFVGTTGTVISRLEDADYDGHSLKMLQRISAALGRRLEIRFVPTRTRRRSA